MKSKIILSYVGFLIIASCVRKEDEINNMDLIRKYINIPSSPFNYSSPSIPSFLKNQFVTIQNNTPSNNPITDWGATLGRVLFYDKMLSKNNNISCSSCHIQKFGFTDTAQFSKGFQGGFTKRHSMALVNSVYYLNGRFFWDERAATLEDQVLMPIQDAVEMGMSLDSIVHRLKASPFYPLLFNYAFGKPEINSNLISKAIAQFVRSMVSYQSKYDIGRNMVSDRNSDFTNFTIEENVGKNIFFNDLKVNCAGCHTSDVFVIDNPRNNGINLNNNDPGIFIHTNDPLDLGKFKAPSLKNVALRNRYMHDGKINSLAKVLEHYNTGILPNPNLDPHLLENGIPIKKKLSDSELNALKAFLETLTDYQIIQDEKFSNPFL